MTKYEQYILKLIIIYNSNGKISGKRYSVDNIDKYFEANKLKLMTLQEKGIIHIYNKQEQEPEEYNFFSSLMQDFVRQEFDKSISDPEERELVLEFDKFKINIPQQKVNMVKIMYRWFLKNIQKIIKNYPFQ
ncbi:MAG: hypothetical protein MGG11_10840 [Trichodesmium sp. MAG_R03]|nr:hypothetical protein [Trichodesmium sp. MAG_R04]MCL2932726.1 hypothetical protein [Trichodesmium sp. MAG_R03]